LNGEGPDAPLALAVAGVSADYRGRVALSQVSLRVRGGERLGMVGPNGAGKSTLLKIVVGLVRPSAGHVEVEGRPAVQARRKVAYLPQRAEVDLGYPAQVRDVVAMGRYPLRGAVGRLRPDDRAAVADALARVGLERLARARIGELSGGQQQRVFLARALAQEAGVLLLDEPYAGLDAATVGLIDRELNRAAAAGAAVVTVDHDLSGLEHRYDRVAVLRGQLLACGPPAQTVTPQVLARAYGAGAVVITGGGAPQ
jgi:ABC-type Mn2+/Zn2+ transport system ATPase subunit